MASFSPFIRKTSPEMREALASAIGLSMPDDVNWDDPGMTFAKSMASAVDALQSIDQAMAVAALERMASMADEVGDIAMDTTWPIEVERPELSGVQDRVVWMYIRHPERFRRAEDARFMDSQRRTRRWDGFVLASNLKIDQTAESKAAFISSLKGKVPDGKVQVDIFERIRRGFDGTEYKVLQVTIYAEQKTEVGLEFHGEQITSVPRRPVRAAALTYEPQSGTIEVAADFKDARTTLLSGFTKHLVHSETSVAALQPRRFDLQSLKVPHKFPTDAGDRIEVVVLRSLRLMPFGREDQRLTIEVGRKSGQSIWDAAEAQFGDRNPLRSGWLVTSAVLSVTFLPAGAAKRGKVVSMQITEPNGCDLKDRTELEQLIGNKYLRRWEILTDEPDIIER